MADSIWNIMMSIKNYEILIDTIVVEKNAFHCQVLIKKIIVIKNTYHVAVKVLFVLTNLRPFTSSKYYNREKRNSHKI